MNISQVICIMGPTASGKTQLALNLCDRLPAEIISVDSAMIYRGMNIGTAKPPPEILSQYPHHLIDIRDPKESYSTAEFCKNAHTLIQDIIQRGKTPLLVGGTLLYFHNLQQGLSPVPPSNAVVRAELTELLHHKGSLYLHERLDQVDPHSAQRIHPKDPQRIIRALEVYISSGKTLTDWWKMPASQNTTLCFTNIGLIPRCRETLRKQIAMRFQTMLGQGFVCEVETLYQRGDLSADLPALRSVGYRQIWQYLAGKFNYHEMTKRSIIATQQLAKRQLTWLRRWENLQSFDMYDEFSSDSLWRYLKIKLNF